MVIRIDRILGVGLLGAALLALAPARGEEREPGVWWEHTFQMEMKDMPMAMPAQTTKICVPKGGMKEPPKGGDDGNCKTTDVKSVGSKMTWKVECGPPEPMTGEGEMVQAKGGYTGQMAMHGKRGDMNMKMTGKLLGGDCDAGATKKQVAALKKQSDEMQAQSNKAMAEMCEKATEEMNMRMFVPPLGLCKDPAQVARICERLPTRPGFLAFRKAQRSDPELGASAKTLCKKDPEEIQASLCSQAVKETRGEQTPKETLRFLSGSCPDEARAFAVKECAGRSYSGDEGMDDPLRGICVRYAKDELAKTDQQKAPAEEPKKKPKEQAVDSAKKALKGLFGK